MDKKALVSCVTETVEAAGFEVVRLLNHPHRVVRVWADREQGGITMDECVRLTRAVRAALEERGEDPGDYQVEVQSPGLDRPLVRAADFERFAGHEVAVVLKEKLDGRRNFKGKLVGLEEGSVVVEDPDGEAPWRFPRRDCKEVRLVPDLPVPGPPRAPGERTRKPRKTQRKRPKQR